MASLALLIKARTGKSQTFVDAAVTAGTDIIVLPGHTFSTGDLVKLSASATLPAGLVATKQYYVIKVSDGSIKLATSAANATAGTAVDITAAAGGGTHTIRLVEGQFIDLTGVDHADARKFAKNLANYFEKLAAGAGNSSASIDVSEDNQDPVAATAAIALTHANLDDADTVTIGGTVITCKTTATDTSVQFQKGADATADGVVLAATINRNKTLSAIMTATEATGTVTLTMKVKGAIGNSIVISTSDATGFGITAFASGTGGACNTVTNYSLGL